MSDRLILAAIARFARCPGVLGRAGEDGGRTTERERERKKKRGASSSCRSVLRFDVGNHAPHSLSAAEIFGFIVCEGLSPRGVLSQIRGRKKRSREAQGKEDVARKEGEEEDRGHADEEGSG